MGSDASEFALTTVGEEQLRTLLRGVHKGTLECPLSPAGLAGHGLQDASGAILGHLRGLDGVAVRAVVVAVLAERMTLRG